MLLGYQTSLLTTQAYTSLAIQFTSFPIISQDSIELYFKIHDIETITLSEFANVSTSEYGNAPALTISS